MTKYRVCWGRLTVQPYLPGSEVLRVREWPGGERPVLLVGRAMAEREAPAARRGVGWSGRSRRLTLRAMYAHQHWWRGDHLDKRVYAAIEKAMNAEYEDWEAELILFPRNH